MNSKKRKTVIGVVKKKKLTNCLLKYTEQTVYYKYYPEKNCWIKNFGF